MRLQSFSEFRLSGLDGQEATPNIEQGISNFEVPDAPNFSIRDSLFDIQNLSSCLLWWHPILLVSWHPGGHLAQYPEEDFHEFHRAIWGPLGKANRSSHSSHRN